MTIRILLCADKSQNALAAVSFGGRLAAAMRSDTTLLAAGKNPQTVQQALKESRTLLQTFGLRPQTTTRIGPATRQFVNQMQEQHYDLVVIGYRRRSKLEKALQGCVAAQVALQAPTSVLIVREGRPDIRNLLIGIGGNGFTSELIDWGVKIARAMGAQVTMMHVEAAPPLMYAGLEEVHQTLAEFLETNTPTAQSLRQAAEVMNKAGIQAEVKVAYGVAERELLRSAQEGDYDLLIVGSAWARPPLDRLVLGNVTNQILLRTSRPVLVVHPVEASLPTKSRSNIDSNLR